MAPRVTLHPLGSYMLPRPFGDDPGIQGFQNHGYLGLWNLLFLAGSTISNCCSIRNLGLQPSFAPPTRWGRLCRPDPDVHTQGCGSPLIIHELYEKHRELHVGCKLVQAGQLVTCVQARVDLSKITGNCSSDTTSTSDGFGERRVLRHWSSNVPPIYSTTVAENCHKTCSFSS